MVGQNFLEHPLAGKFEIIAPRSAELDLRDFPQVAAFVKKCQPDFIVHAAGKVGGIQANMSAPVDFLVENMDMGRNIVLAARQAGVHRLLNLGSSCMYPRQAPNPLQEEMILTGELEPTNEGYALAKIMTARLCQYISTDDESFQYKTFIPCNIYGRHDKFDPAHSHLIPAIIHKIYQARQDNHAPVEIWGDGQARREFMYAADLADAMMCAVEKFGELPTYMNIGVGDDNMITTYYEVVAKVLGYEGEFIYDTSKPVGMMRKLVSVARQTKWGWAPQVSLEDGIARTYDYYLNS